MKRFRTYIQKHKGISLAAVFGITLIVYLMTSDTINLPQRGNQSPAPSASSTPAPSGVLHLTKTSQVGTVMKSLWSVEPVTFYFDDVIDISTVSFKVFPPIDAFISSDIEEKNPTSFAIVPRTGWKEGITYTIRIAPTLRSFSNKVLDSEVVVTFQREVPSAEELEIPETAF